MIGEAGFERAQDCRVTVALKEEGGISVALHSKLEKMFGKLMIQSAKDELKELGVENADVEIFDAGSLDYVIRARVKTAVGRAGKGGIKENE
jgi:citrate lyase subunit gamma (acyl carrier protein)